jgi:cellobiose phosphorylase
MAFAALGDGARAWELFGMINPLEHAGTPADVAIYKVEPYVVAADVYAVPPHTGRGGWTWYTGSAGWLYRLILESLLGVSLEGESLRITPVLPADWKPFTIHYRYRDTLYHIVVRAAENGEASLAMDGVEREGSLIPLTDDRREHGVEVRVPVGRLSAIG